MSDESEISLDRLHRGASGEVTTIDWQGLSPRDCARLRNFGFDEGVRVEALHRGPFGGDPLAIRVGRMQVAIRGALASAVRVRQQA